MKKAIQQIQTCCSCKRAVRHLKEEQNTADVFLLENTFALLPTRNWKCRCINQIKEEDEIKFLVAGTRFGRHQLGLPNKPVCVQEQKFYRMN